MPPLKRDRSRQATSEQIRERKTNRRVASVLERLIGTDQERPIFKGFREYGTQRGISEKERRRTARNPLFTGLTIGALGEIRTSLLNHSGIKRFSLQFGPREKSRGRAERCLWVKCVSPGLKGQPGKPAGSDPIPATTFVITHSPSRSNHRDGFGFSEERSGRDRVDPAAAQV